MMVAANQLSLVFSDECISSYGLLTLEKMSDQPSATVQETLIA